MKIFISVVMLSLSATVFAEAVQVEPLNDKFPGFDTNSDEIIDKDEASGTNLEDYFQVIDLNGDDMISRLEFKEYIKAYPSIVSPNRPQ